MAKVLGRVTGSYTVARGPDVEHRIHVEREWLEVGAAIEFKLPRNLTCAACGGGGCDACGRSGAVTLRDRREPPELVQVTLPKSARQTQDGRVVIRIPERGGRPEPGREAVRGLLLLTVIAADEPDSFVQRVASPVELAPHQPQVRVVPTAPPEAPRASTPKPPPAAAPAPAGAPARSYLLWAVLGFLLMAGVMLAMRSCSSGS